MTRLGLAARGDNRLSPEDVAWAVDRGVNYLNWCGRKDGLSRYVRESGRRRASLVVAVQFQARTAEEAKRELESVCESLGAMPDILTLYYVESQEEWELITSGGGAWEELVERRRGGPLAMIGLTSHQRRLAARWAQQTSPDGERRLDLLMIRYNAAHRGAEREVFPVADRVGLPTVCFTGLRWGKLLEPSGGEAWTPSAVDCYRFCLSNPSANVVLTAPKNTEELEESLTLLDDWRACNDTERRRIKAHGDRVRSTAGEFW